MMENKVNSMVEDSKHKMFALLCMVSVALASVNLPAATYYLTDGDGVATAGVAGAVGTVGGATVGGVATAGAAVGTVLATGGAAVVAVGAAAA